MKTDKMEKRIIDKVNEGQESDVKPYTWEAIPTSLKQFWIKQLTKP